MLPLMEKNMERLAGDVAWMVEKFDYRNQDADWKDSRDAIQRMSEDVSEALLAIEGKREALAEVYRSINDQIDYSSLPASVDGEKLRKMLDFTVKGLMTERLQDASFQPDGGKIRLPQSGCRLEGLQGCYPARYAEAEGRLPCRRSLPPL